MSFKDVFENDYPGAEEITQSCFEPVFGSIQKARKSLTENLSEGDRQTIKDIFILGSSANFSFGDMNFFDVTIQDKVDIARNRVNIQRAVRKALDIYQAAIVIFHYSDSQRLWRLSFIHREGSSKDTTSAKRYSYLCGKERYCRTVADRFNELERVQGKKRLEDVTKVFSIEALTKEFFNDLFKWYDTWAIHLVKFPTGKGANAALPKKPDVEKNRQHLIRLITRLIFVWFLKQKDNLVPSLLFDKEEIAKILNNFDPHSEKQGNYYNGVIQNLFFATLNKPIKERKFANMQEEKRVDDYSIKTVFRDFIDKSLFVDDYNPVKHPLKFIELFNSIPFLNGGLFECLDNFDTKEYVDGFSRERERAAFVPNCLFWGDNDHEGLIPLLNRFNFTIEENTPQDIDIALDPELLGKVFENLLGTYNEETRNTARKESGSFYTPREIVDYMVDTSLKEYFKVKLDSKDNAINEKLDKLFLYHESDHDFDNKQVTLLMNAINNCKVLDPACGSGAFPMGILNKLAFIMQKLDPKNEIWRELQNKKVKEENIKADEIKNREKRNKRLNEIKRVFDMSTSEYSNYARKLFLLENCIYGVDIQPIAIQITKLRFFISLITDQKIGGNIDNNYNVLPLPNLETKFIAANTLIGIKREHSSFIDPDVEDKYNELLEIRHDHISAWDAWEKIKLRKRDELLCKELAELLKKGVFSSDEVDKLLSWNPYNQTKSAGFFDPAWMFAFKKENTSLNLADKSRGYFDIVIGNPPYISAPTMVETNEDGRRAIIESGCFTTLYQKWDLYIPFIELGLQLLTINGTFTMIVPYPLTNQTYAKKLRELILNQYNMFEIVDLSGTKVFENATVSNCIPFIAKSNSNRTCYISHINEHKQIFHSFKKNYLDLVQDEKASVWNLTAEKREISRYSEMNVLGDFCYISVGMVLNSDEKTAKGEFSKDDLISETYDVVHCRKYIEAKDIERYVVKRVRFLEYNTERCPDKLRRPTFRELYENHKLMFNRLGNLTVFYDDKEKYLHSDSMYSAVLWKDLKGIQNKSIKASIKRYSRYSRKEMESYSKQIDLRYLIGILNSKYANILLSNLRGGDYHIYPEHLRNFPVPLIKKDKQKNIIDLVNQIIASKKDDLISNTSNLEQKIDKQVYEIYDLSLDEINAIEKQACYDISDNRKSLS